MFLKIVHFIGVCETSITVKNESTQYFSNESTNKPKQTKVGEPKKEKNQRNFILSRHATEQSNNRDKF